MVGACRVKLRLLLNSAHFTGNNDIVVSIMYISTIEGDLTEAQNYCRGVGTEKPWCYTLDPDVMWESCEIPTCEGQH